MNLSHNLKSYSHLLFKWSILVLIGFFTSCETEQNPMENSYFDKQNIVYNAEKRTDQLVWELDVNQAILTIPNDGFDPLFLPENYPFKEVSNTTKPLRHFCRQSQFSETEFEKIHPLLNYFENQQNEIIKVARELQKSCLDSLISFKNDLSIRLNEGTITQIQYDLLLTKSEETFLVNLRHKYNESRVLITSSSNLHEVLNNLEKTLSKKSWESLISRLMQE